MPPRQVAYCSGVEPRLLQGTFEKIRLQRFVRYQPLQLGYLKPQFTFFGVLRRCLAVINRLHLIAPFVQQPAMHAQFFRQRDNIFAALQPLNCHLPECLRVVLPSSRCHSQFLSLQGVPIASVSILGFSPWSSGSTVGNRSSFGRRSSQARISFASLAASMVISRIPN